MSTLSKTENGDYAIIVKNLFKRFAKNSVGAASRALLGRETKNSHDFTALDDISFKVRCGESVGILGLNGSGKSTLLQIIANVLQPSSGHVVTKGKLAALLELGSGFNPDFTGLENIYLNASILGLTQRETKEILDDILEFADIGDFIHRPVSTYSSGMRMRLAFAVQSFIEPEILIVDEALGVGDHLFKMKCFERINTLLESGISFLYVSHSEETIRRLTSRAIVLHKGKLIMDGQVQDAIDEYHVLMGQQRRENFSNVLDNSQTKKSLSINQQDIYHKTHILSVKVLDKSERNCDNFITGDMVKIEITFINYHKTEGLSAGLRIRNKEGLKIYSWATANYESYHSNKDGIGKIFEKAGNSKSVFSVQFEFICNLGSNLYQVEAFITHENKSVVDQKEVLDWISEAGFFRVEVDKSKNFFGGVCDLGMKVSLKDSDQ